MTGVISLVMSKNFYRSRGRQLISAIYKFQPGWHSGTPEAPAAGRGRAAPAAPFSGQPSEPGTAAPDPLGKRERGAGFRQCRLLRL